MYLFSKVVSPVCEHISLLCVVLDRSRLISSWIFLIWMFSIFILNTGVLCHSCWLNWEGFLAREPCVSVSFNKIVWFSSYLVFFFYLFSSFCFFALVVLWINELKHQVLMRSFIGLLIHTHTRRQLHTPKNTSINHIKWWTTRKPFAENNYSSPCLWNSTR